MTAPVHLREATAIAAAIAAGEASAMAVAEATLARIDALNGRYNCYTAVTRERALHEAAAMDALRARGDPLPPLAGVPYAVKNLFDIAGMTTLAGAKIEADNPPATRDATLVTRMAAAGAVLTGALNMDEYAYGFVTENEHYGTTHNPHDVTRIAGGSSGGSAAAVAAGLVPLTLGSDTSGSIRVPASLCGVFGLKPTYGRLPRSGSQLFVASLDHLGPFARSVADLAVSYDAMQGPDVDDPACAQRPVDAVAAQLNHDIGGLRIAVADGYFVRNASADALAVVDRVARALSATTRISLPEADRARAAAFVITASEGANLHLANLRIRANDFDRATRDRFLAGAMVPASWYLQAQRFRAWFSAQVRELFRGVDVILAPASPVPAPLIGQATFDLNGSVLPTRSALGLLAQPLSFIGVPIVCVPAAPAGMLPMGVQVIAAPWREDLALRVAATLERAGVSRAPIAAGAVE
jgi:AtzE family amidohydrolase